MTHACTPRSRSDDLNQAALPGRAAFKPYAYRMDGPNLLVASMSTPLPRGADGYLWQYHSRSDTHSKVACWGIMYDLLQHSDVLREHVTSGKVVFGINFEINDFVHHRKKNLDLVIARPQHGVASSGETRTFASLTDAWSIQLTPDQHRRLDMLPAFVEGAFGANAVLLALEAKACMTAHSKAGPRLFDELNSSHQIIHAASERALAVGFVMINSASTFLSPDMNRRRSYTEADHVSEHKQPAAAQTAMRRVESLPTRSGASGHGYDGIAAITVDMPNDGTRVRLDTRPPAPSASSPYNYGSMISRVANEYDGRFSGI